MAADPVIGFTINPVDVPGVGDERLYADVVEDARLGYRLGYDVAYVVEHHFSDYFPIPDPLLLFARLAPECPGLGFGTMVLVTPWHQPLRLAEQIAMLSNVCSGELHLGLGRGNAPLEYEAFDVDMSQTLERYEETWRILDLALRGEPFTYQGRYLRVPRLVRVRPQARNDRIHFYGAIGNPDSAARIAGLGLAPMSNGFLPFERQKQIMAAWDACARADGRSTDVGRPVVISCIVAETDAEAGRQAREYLPQFFRAAVRHYDVEIDPYKTIPTFEAWSRQFAYLKVLSDPDNLGPYIEVALIGSAATVRRRVEQYLECGFNNFMIMCSTPGVPPAVRRDWLTRFATQVAPEFSNRILIQRRARGQ